MLKQWLLLLLAAGLISLASSYATAQDSSSNDQQSPPSHGNGPGRHGGPPDPAQRTQELTKKLNLTSDQQSKVQDIFKSEQSQMQGLRQDSSTSQDDRRAKMMEIRNNTNTQVRALLDADQQKKWDEIQAKRQE